MFSHESHFIFIWVHCTGDASLEGKTCRVHETPLQTSNRSVFESILNPGQSLIHIRCIRPTRDEVVYYVVREHASTNELSARSMQRARNRYEIRSSSPLARLHLRTSLLTTSYEYVNVTAMDTIKFQLFARWKGDNWLGKEKWNNYERISICNYRLLSLFIPNQFH